MTKTLDELQAEYVALHRRDVEESPTAYKASVVADPDAAARVVIEGLDIGEMRQLLAMLRAERRACAKGAS